MNLALDKLPINLFDLVVLLVLTAGIFRGRKHGMSEELVHLLQWLAILFGCAALYPLGGQVIGGWTSLFGPLGRYLSAYIAGGVLILLLFALIRRYCGHWLLGSDAFGKAEYYLGMASGLVRFACMLVVVLALLNARYFSPAEVKAMEKYTEDNYGSDYWPTLHSVQQTVFEKSVTGPLIKQHLGFLLIKPTEPQHYEFHQKEFGDP
ncbi:MAG TPA: CvpA family protein [Candidatus Acidoferrum sp.]|nr:CvpA family protein [Candidatus Acidoferrum sp.]